jgi:prephenate dehydrogenase
MTSEAGAEPGIRSSEPGHTSQARTSPGSSSPTSWSAEYGPVLIVGVGLIGASVGMALIRAGVETYVTDADPTVAHVAASRGAGSDAQPPSSPGLVVVATPPEQLGAEIAAALTTYREAVVTDVGSVKGRPLEQLAGFGLDIGRYVGGHPMAGSERSGPLASAADLFDGRTWAVVDRPDCAEWAVARVAALAEVCGARVVRLTTDEHDLAVARISHLPHLLAALTARQLTDAPAEHLALSGQGVRDVTRVAAGDPGLWQQIVTANADALRFLLLQVREGVDELLDSLAAGDGVRVERLLAAGVAGTAAIPGKHGGPTQVLVPVTVAIPDEPGALAKLFADVGAVGVNIEDLRIDHDPARAYGHVEIDVAAAAADGLVASLADRGWAAHR